MTLGKNNDELMCRVIRLDYDFINQVGSVWLPDGNCVDAQGCINLFERIDPKVQRIHTYEADNPDTFYVLENKKWKSYVYSKGRSV